VRIDHGAFFLGFLAALSAAAAALAALSELSFSAIASSKNASVVVGSVVCGRVSLIFAHAAWSLPSSFLSRTFCRARPASASSALPKNVFARSATS
jgi:hypothetical protein